MNVLSHLVRPDLSTDDLLLRAVLETVGEGIVVINTSSTVVMVNQEAQRMWGYTEAEMIGQPLHMLMPPSERAPHTKGMHHYLETGEAPLLNARAELPAQHRDGTIFPIEICIKEVPLEGGRVFAAAVNDITERKRTEQLLVGQNRVLELIATATSLDTVLTAICHITEDYTGGIASIMRFDPATATLRIAAAPSLPASYCAAIADGIATGAMAGSCGTAAWRLAPVIVSDIAADPRWSEYCDLAVAHGLHACWSVPILGANRKLLGTFGVYSRHTHTPTTDEVTMIERVAHLAGIAIEREIAAAALTTSEANLWAVVENSSDSVWSIDRSYQLLTFNSVFKHEFQLAFGIEIALGLGLDDLLPTGAYPSSTSAGGRTTIGRWPASASRLSRPIKWPARRDHFWSPSTQSGMRARSPA